jgi:hypothetical protein
LSVNSGLSFSSPSGRLTISLRERLRELGQGVEAS